LKTLGFVTPHATQIVKLNIQERKLTESACDFI